MAHLDTPVGDIPWTVEALLPLIFDLLETSESPHVIVSTKTTQPGADYYTAHVHEDQLELFVRRLSMTFVYRASRYTQVLTCNDQKVEFEDPRFLALLTHITNDLADQRAQVLVAK
ncbi:hypothetical protein EBR96_05125 [bacterium]|nr:hypothetical protein [bacterium]